MVRHEELDQDIGVLRYEIGALRVKLECPHQPEGCYVARLLAELQRDW